MLCMFNMFNMLLYIVCCSNRNRLATRNYVDEKIIPRVAGEGIVKAYFVKDKDVLNSQYTKADVDVTLKDLLAHGMCVDIVDNGENVVVNYIKGYQSNDEIYILENSDADSEDSENSNYKLYLISKQSINNYGLDSSIGYFFIKKNDNNFNYHINTISYMRQFADDDDDLRIYTASKVHYIVEESVSELSNMKNDVDGTLKDVVTLKEDVTTLKSSITDKVSESDVESYLTTNNYVKQSKLDEYRNKSDLEYGDGDSLALKSEIGNMGDYVKKDVVDDETYKWIDVELKKIDETDKYAGMYYTSDKYVIDYFLNQKKDFIINASAKWCHSYGCELPNTKKVIKFKFDSIKDDDVSIYNYISIYENDVDTTQLQIKFTKNAPNANDLTMIFSINGRFSSDDDNRVTYDIYKLTIQQPVFLGKDMIYSASKVDYMLNNMKDEINESVIAVIPVIPKNYVNLIYEPYVNPNFQVYAIPIQIKDRFIMLSLKVEDDEYNDVFVYSGTLKFVETNSYGYDDYDDKIMINDDLTLNIVNYKPNIDNINGCTIFVIKHMNSRKINFKISYLVVF